MSECRADAACRMRESSNHRTPSPMNSRSGRIGMASSLRWFKLPRIKYQPISAEDVAKLRAKARASRSYFSAIAIWYSARRAWVSFHRPGPPIILGDGGGNIMFTARQPSIHRHSKKIAASKMKFNIKTLKKNPRANLWPASKIAGSSVVSNVWTYVIS